jgi:flagellar hook-length control protein FliK
LKGGEKLQLGMINSLRKMELASGSQGIPSEKIDGQFMLMLNALKTRPPQNESSQKDGQAKEGINQLLDILSSSADVSLMSNREDKLEAEAVSFSTVDDQLSLNLKHLVTTYHSFSDREETLDLDVSNLGSILTNTFANLESKITQVLKNETNTKIAPDMFNQTELPVLLSDLKQLEHTANNLPDISVNEKISETVQDLQGLIVSITKFIESNESTKKNVEKDTNLKAGYSFTNENNFIVGYNKLSSTKITVQKADKEQAIEVKQEDTDAILSEADPSSFMFSNPEKLEVEIEAPTSEILQSSVKKLEHKSETNVSENSIGKNEDIRNFSPTEQPSGRMNKQMVDQANINPRVKNTDTNHAHEGNHLVQMNGKQDYAEGYQEGLILPTDQNNQNSVSKVNNAVESLVKETTIAAESTGEMISKAPTPNTVIDRTKDNPLWIAINPNNGLENQKENSQSIKNSLLDSNSEETATSFNEAELMASKENGENVKRFSTMDSKLLAIQNRVLLETRYAVGKEANTTKQKIDTLQSTQSNLFQGDNRLTEATTELKSIISSILSKLDKQPEGKSATVVQKVMNPIMVSSLRKTGDIILPYVGMKEAVEVSQEDANTNVLPSMQNSYIKQHPFVLLTDTGKMAQPKDVEEQFTKLLANSTFTKVGDMQKLSIRLAPDHLGSIRIEITQNEGNMIARIITTNAEAKEALDKQLTSLKHGFTAQNLQVDKLDIVVSTPPQEKLQKEQQQQQEQQQSQSQREKKDADEEEKNRKSSFFDELLNMEI